MYHKLKVQSKSACSEDQQPNENINKRSQEAPPAILAAGPRTQTAFRGRRNDWGERGNGFRGRGSHNHGRGRGGRNWHWYRAVAEGSMYSAGPSRTQGNYGAPAPVSSGATVDPSPHRMPPTTANLKPPSTYRNESQKQLKNLHFVPRRPKPQRSPSLPPDEPISLFTPPLSPLREPSPLPSEGVCSSHETPEYRSPSQDHPPLLTPSSPSPHLSRRFHTPPTRHYRDVAVQAEEEKVLIPRKRALISSPVLGASVLAARSPSPKRLKPSDVDTKVEVKVERQSPVADALIFAPVASPPLDVPSGPPSLPKIKEELELKSDAAMLEPDRVIKSELAVITAPDRPKSDLEIPKQTTSPPPVSVVKHEQSPSPPPSVLRLKVTSRTEWFPLPENCRKTSPRWVENRRLLFHREAVKFTRRGFKVTKQLWRQVLQLMCMVFVAINLYFVGPTV
ncbi:hypothetical protein L218DRAFT_296420 [Marasmius fiardii PR-910]|nr:hypothetical protein L218DRAFT_296420 [Marasmius fiardii PR-910]